MPVESALATRPVGSVPCGCPAERGARGPAGGWWRQAGAQAARQGGGVLLHLRHSL